jgi:uncharacterized protein YcbX
MQGESLERAEVGNDGLLGDRAYVIREFSSNTLVSAESQTHPWGPILGAEQLIQFKAEYLEEPEIDDLSDVSVAAGDGSSLSSRDNGLDEFMGEILHRKVGLVSSENVPNARTRGGRALHLLTTASMRKIREYYPSGEFDVKRFRPNIVVDTLNGRDGFLEEDWLGETISVGPEVRVRIEKPNKRCVVTTMRQGTLPSDDKILETITTKNQSNLGVMCSVIRGGIVRVGEAVQTTD